MSHYAQGMIVEAKGLGGKVQSPIFEVRRWSDIPLTDTWTLEASVGDLMHTPVLFERLKVDLTSDIAIEKRLASFEAFGKHTKKLVDISQELDISALEQIVLGLYLLEQLDAVEDKARRLIELVENYLFGSWREAFGRIESVPDKTAPYGYRQVNRTLNTEDCRRGMVWMAQFRAGMLWALCFKEEDAILRLAQYPGDDVSDEAPSSHEFGRAEKALYILLAAFLRGDAKLDWDSHADIIARSRKKKPKLLLSALSQIRVRNGESFLSVLGECIRHHVRTELPQRGLDNKLALDPSILYHTAIRAGMTIAVPEKYRDHLVVSDPCES